MLWVLPISSLPFDKVSKTFSPDLQWSGLNQILPNTIWRSTGLIYGCILYIAAFLGALPASYERFPVVIPARWKKLATQSLVVICTTNRELDAEPFINK